MIMAHVGFCVLCVFNIVFSVGGTFWEMDLVSATRTLSATENPMAADRTWSD